MGANLGRLLVCGSMLVAIPLSVFSTRATLTKVMSRAFEDDGVRMSHNGYSSDDLDIVGKSTDLKVGLLEAERPRDSERRDGQQELDSAARVVHVIPTACIILLSMSL